MDDTKSILAAIGKLDVKLAVLIDRSERTESDVQENKRGIQDNREKIGELEKSSDAFVAFKDNFDKALWKILTPPLGYIGLAAFIVIAVVIWIMS